MATYHGNCNQLDVVVATFSQPVNARMRVENTGDCAVLVQLWGGQHGGDETDRRTIRGPVSPVTACAADVAGDQVTRVTIACLIGRGDCKFTYTIAVD
jgi:hypothetical protein